MRSAPGPVEWLTFPAPDDPERQFRVNVSFLLSNFECIFGGVATPLFNDGLLTLSGGRIKLTDRGLEMADSVFAEFV